MAKLASLNLKVSPELKAEFMKTAEALGMPASTALKVLVTRFYSKVGFRLMFEFQGLPSTGTTRESFTRISATAGR